MAWTQVCYQYDGTFPGFLSCVFDSYVYQEEPAQFLGPEELCCSLYPHRTVLSHLPAGEGAVAVALSPPGL